MGLNLSHSNTFVILTPAIIRRRVINRNIMPQKVTSKQFKILIIKANEMHWFLKFIFGIELYMFRTCFLPIISSLSTVYTAKGICHTGYVDCMLEGSGLFQWIWEICASLWFYYKNISRCTVLWMSNRLKFFGI